MKKRTFKKLKRVLIILFSLILIIFAFCLLLSPKDKDEKVENTLKKGLEAKEIVLENETYKINIDYPLYNVKNIDVVIEDYLNERISEITKSELVNSLNIDYEIFKINELDYLVFDIQSSLEENLKYKTFLIDGTDVISYENIIDVEKMKEKIINYISVKYSKNIVNSISELDFNFLNYLINNDEIKIYFNEVKTSKISYVPSVHISKENLKNILKTEYDIEKEYEFKEIVKDKVIALTFDDGPSDITGDILDVLKSYDAHATFFALGNRMKIYKTTIQRIVEEGNEVASHTYSHKDLSTLDEKGILNQINTTNVNFNSITGKKINYVRPPYGTYNSKVLSTVEHPLIMWNIDTKDWDNRNAEKTANTVIKKAFNGGIALMHDLYSSNIEALKIMLPELEAKGYKFVTISEMSEEFGVTLEKGKAYRYIE